MRAEPSRPDVPDYGIPTDTDGVLDWEHVATRIEASRNYWICTATPDGTPHAVPTWGVWVDGTLHFGGGPRTRWARNLARNPQVTVHLESGDEVVVLEGTVSPIADATDPRLTPIDDAYEAKYDMRHGPVIWTLRPRRAFAWADFPHDATRWVFEDA